MRCRQLTRVHENGPQFTCPMCERVVCAQCEGGSSDDISLNGLCDLCWFAEMEGRQRALDRNCGVPSK